MRAREFVTEAFDRPYAMNWEHGDESHDALVHLPDGGTLSIMFSLEHPYDSDAEEWHVEFYRNFSQEITGEGDQQRIFATVLEAIREFVAMEHPEHIRFSANKDVEPGQKAQTRTNLYNRLVQRYASSLGYQTEISDFGGSTVYNLFKLYEGMAEAVHPDVVSKQYFNDPTPNVKMGDFEFNARTFTGGMADPNARGLQIRAYDPRRPKGQNLIGSADFVVKSNKKCNRWLESDDTEVEYEYHGRGVAAMMYAFAKMLGNDIKDSPFKSWHGAQMWKKWGQDAQHLVGEQDISEEQLDELTFLGSQCTKDCSGHRAGYDWSKRKGLRQANSWSPSFNKGSALAVAGK